MNRIRHLIADETDCSLATLAPQKLDYPAPQTGARSHCLLAPLHYEPNYAYPLVVWLHGPGDDERQVNRVMPLVSTRNYVSVGVRGTLEPTDGSLGYLWAQSERHIALAEQRVLAAVSEAQLEFNIAGDRIYLAGYDGGGTMALRLALNQPAAFAGALSMEGAFPRTLRPLALLQDARKLKIFLALGRDSRLYPERQVCADLRLFHTAAMSVEVRLYPGGDDLTTGMLADMDRWIMQQVAGIVTAPADEPSHRGR